MRFHLLRFLLAAVSSTQAQWSSTSNTLDHPACTCHTMFTQWDLLNLRAQGLSSLPKHGSMPSSSLIGGQAIGSLPKGLTADDRKAILQATPMSPSLSLLNSMGPVRPLDFCLDLADNVLDALPALLALNCRTTTCDARCVPLQQPGWHSGFCCTPLALQLVC